jgi:hypothetical protein
MKELLWGSEYNKPMAEVLKGPAAEIYLYFLLYGEESFLRR